MNDIIQNMLDRHSCRSFTAQPIEQEKLDDLITAAASLGYAAAPAQVHERAENTVSFVK